MDQGRQFKALYASLGFNASEVAQLLHVSSRSVHNWVSGAVSVPFMAVKLLRLMLRYELPGKAWEGWHLSAGRLYTPEGFELVPHEVSWWSLLVRQARLFRSMYQDKWSTNSGPVAEPATTPDRTLGRDVLVTRPVSLTGGNSSIMRNPPGGSLVTPSESFTGETAQQMPSFRRLYVTPSGILTSVKERRQTDHRATFRECPRYAFRLTSIAQKGGAR